MSNIIKFIINICLSIFYSKNKIINIIILTLYLTTSGISQPILPGLPPIDNFGPEVFFGGTQTWDIEIGKDGEIYAANNEGIIQFDGQHWVVHALPNGTIARSLAIVGNRIYYGGQDEIGYLEFSNGKPEIVSLSDEIPPLYQNLEDIWQTDLVYDQIIFRNKDHILSLDSNHRMHIIYTNSYSETYGIDGNKIIFDINDKEIISRDIATDQVDRLYHGERLFDPVGYFINSREQLVVCTTNDGFFVLQDGKAKKWQPASEAFFRKNKITTTALLSGNRIAIGTRFAGLVILDRAGQILQLIDKSAGLQNNSIRCIAEDHWNNLWLGMEYGIDRINYNLGLSTFYPDGKLEGANFDICYFKDSWYFCTNNGLYKYTPSTTYHENSELVSNSEGQAWGVDVIDRKLYLAHDHGGFVLNSKNELEQIEHLPGTWKFISLSKSKMAVGAYDGIYLFNKTKRGLTLDYKIPNLNESSRILIKKNSHEIWMSHPYRGVYQIQFDKNYSHAVLKRYGKEDGLECVQNNYIFLVDHSPIVSNPCGIYKFEETKNTFSVAESLQSQFSSEEYVTHLIDHPPFVWYITDKSTGRLTKGLNESAQYQKKTTLPHLHKQYVGGFEHIFPINSRHIIYSTNKGVKMYESGAPKNKPKLEARVKKIILPEYDSIIAPSNHTITLSPEENDLRFEFTTNGLITKDIRFFRYKLEGYNNQWTASSSAYKEYTNLASGSYIFKLQAITFNNISSDIDTIRIDIHKVWYKSYAALILYGISFIATLILAVVIPSKKHKKATKELVIKQQEVEQEIEDIKREKLEDKIRFKNNELASTALHLVQKNQTLNSVRIEIEKIRKNTKKKEVKDELKKLLSILNTDSRLEEDWDRFSIHFDRVHADFLKTLKSKFPKLTRKDYRLCALLKLNLSTKEIAQLLHISPRGVEISRYRLRKKLGIETSVNLNQFMNQLSSESSH